MMESARGNAGMVRTLLTCPSIDVNVQDKVGIYFNNGLHPFWYKSVNSFPSLLILCAGWTDCAYGRFLERPHRDCAITPGSSQH